MSLRANTYVALIGAAFIAIALVFTVTIYAGRAWIHAGERSIAASAMNQVKRAIDVDVSAMALTARDWASWDDTYRFAHDRNPTYVGANLTSDTVKNLDVDALVIVARSGTVVGAVYSPVLLRSPALRASLLAEVRPGGTIMTRAAAGKLTRGAIETSQSAFLFAARPILPNSETGPPRGAVVIARYMDPQRVAHLGEIANVGLLGLSPDSGAIPQRVRRPLWSAPAAAPVAIDVVRPIDIHGYLRVDDLRGNPALVLESHRPPLSYDMAVRVLTGLIGVFLVGGLIWSLLAFGIVDRTSLSRITWLRDSMSHIAEGGQLTARIDLTEAPNPDEAWAVATGVNAMLDALQSSHDRVVQSEEHHRVLVESMADAVLTMSEDGQFTFANAQAEQLTGWSRAQLVGMSYGALVTRESEPFVERALSDIGCGSQAQVLEVQFVRADGYTFPAELSVSPVCDPSGALTAVHWIARDVTERKRFEDQLLHLASHDHLTGLFNRRRFEEEIGQHFAETRRHGDLGAMLWIDVDHFKEVNDTYGHRVGDDVLVRVANVLAEKTREDHVLCRLGGDEFAVLIPRGDKAEALAAAERILGEMRRSIVATATDSIKLTASIGVATFPDQATSVEELLLHADVAMYRAKEAGRNRVLAYTPGDDWPTQLLRRREWSERIETALADESLVVHAQPIRSLPDRSVMGYELLVRMIAEDGAVLVPGEFLGAAEELGLIGDIDRWMVRQAAAIAASWPEGPEPATLFVNLSAKTLSDPSLLELVRDALAETGAAPQRLGFELTETALVSNMSRARELIETLREMGCRFALDDFGSGFSSLNYLRHMPVDILKIDGTLVREMAESGQDRHLVRAITELGHALGITVTAEFVEDERTLKLLTSMGVDHVQGYYVGEPGPVAEVLGDAEDADLEWRRDA